jgi:hypothetical protein
MALWICDIKFGSPINQRKEYNRRIPQNIVFSLNQWMTFNNIVNPSMEEYYTQAITCQAQLTTQGMSLTRIMPLTTQRSTIKALQSSLGSRAGSSEPSQAGLKARLGQAKPRFSSARVSQANWSKSSARLEPARALLCHLIFGCRRIKPLPLEPAR